MIKIIKGKSDIIDSGIPVVVGLSVILFMTCINVLPERYYPESNGVGALVESMNTKLVEVEARQQILITKILEEQ